MSYDTILLYLGEFGPYQRYIYTLLWISAMPHAFHMVNFVFLNEEPPFRCAVPGLPNDTFHIQNEAHSRLVNASIPWDSDAGHYSHCHAYGDPNNDLGNGLEDGHVFVNRTWVTCDRWVYDHGAAPNSLVPEFNLVCERKIYKTHMGMVIMVGLLVGSLFGGTLSDYFGRKRIMMLMLTMWMFLAFGLTFVKTIGVFMIIKCVMSGIGMASFLALFVLVAEIVGPSKRGMAVLGTLLPWAFTMGIVPLTYYLCHDWHTAQLISTVPVVALLALWWALDESPRWLIITNKSEKAMKVIKKIATKNKVTTPANVDRVVALGSSLVEKKVKQDKVWKILTDRVMLLRLVILGLNWGIINVCYYGFTLNVGNIIKGNLHLNVLLQCLMEISSVSLCMFCSGRMGRKPLYSGCIIVGGVACLLSSVLPLANVDVMWINMTTFCLGRFGMSGAFASVYVMTAEMIPTTSRNFGLGLCSVCGRAFGVIAPYIGELGLLIPGKFGTVFPMMIYGISSILCGLSIFLLPETRNKTLPDTIRDANQIETDKLPEPQEMVVTVNGSPTATA